MCDTCELCHLGDAPVDGVEVGQHQEIRGNRLRLEDMEDKVTENRCIARIRATCVSLEL